MACGPLADGITKKLKNFGFEITREMEVNGGCVINFRDPRIFNKVRRLTNESTAEYDATGSIAISDDGKIEVNIPVPTKRHIEWYITCGEKMYVPHVYLRDKYAVFGIKGNGLSEEDLSTILNAAISVRSSW